MVKVGARKVTGSWENIGRPLTNGRRNLKGERGTFCQDRKCTRNKPKELDQISVAQDRGSRK